MTKIVKKMISMTLATTLALSIAAPSFAKSALINEQAIINYKATALINAVDEMSLLKDAVANVVDDSVPVSVRDSIAANAEFTPETGVAKNAMELEVNTTVQKIGEIAGTNGGVSNVYAAVAATDVKIDDGYVGKHGIEAFAIVYWIDNYGANNQLHAVSGEWRTQGVAVTNRQVKYGTTDPGWFTWTGSTPTTMYPSSNYAYYEDSTYNGLTFRCETKIDVVNVGTVTCNVGSRINT